MKLRFLAEWATSHPSNGLLAYSLKTFLVLRLQLKRVLYLLHTIDKI